jgi:hypothetical protein
LKKTLAKRFFINGQLDGISSFQQWQGAIREDQQSTLSFQEKENDEHSNHPTRHHAQRLHDSARHHDQRLIGL